MVWSFTSRYPGHIAAAVLALLVARQWTQAFEWGVHVPLAVTEDVFPESQLEITLSAPKGAVGMVVIDLGLLEVD